MPDLVHNDNDVIDIVDSRNVATTALTNASSETAGAGSFV